jgi:hypothetical protein
MANTLTPFGFLEYNGGAGGAPTFSQSRRLIAAGNATAIYCGDPVAPVTGSANGYITQASPGTTMLAGIFAGCRYLSVAQKRPVWSRYWPGSDANGDVEAYIIDNPQSRFLVQTSGAGFPISGSLTAFGSSVIGQYAQFAVGTGNANTGTSGAYLSSVGTTVTLPFIVLDYVTFPPGQNGTDPTTQFCNVVVGFNNEYLRTSGAGPTGIS